MKLSEYTRQKHAFCTKKFEIVSGSLLTAKQESFKICLTLYILKNIEVLHKKITETGEPIKRKRTADDGYSATGGVVELIGNAS